MTRWLLACALCLLTSVAHGRSIYVDNQIGADERLGSSPKLDGASGGPVRTIKRALELAKQGDQVILANTGVPYNESITLQSLRQSGTPNRPFRIVGNGAVLDGTKPIPYEAWQWIEGSLFRFRPVRKAYHMLYEEGRPLPRHILAAGESPAVLPADNYCLHNGYVYFRTSQKRVPSNYDLRHTALSVGITLYHVDYVEISDIVIQGFQLDGINAHDKVREAVVTGVISRGNGRSGLSVGGSSKVRLEYSLLGNNGVAQVRAEGYSTTNVVECDLLENPAPKVLREGGSKIDVIEPPAQNAKRSPKLDSLKSVQTKWR